MKKIKLFINCLSLYGIAILIFSCKGMYDNITPYAKEIVYPAKYDTIISHIGYNRVELDLMKAGRIPSDQISMGKSKKTVIEYDDQQIVIDSLVSWVNVPDLDQSKLYRIRVYTVDEYDNKSVAQEIAVIPFTEADVNNIAIASPRVLTSPNAAVIDWTNQLSTILLDYKSLEYEYEDQDGADFMGTRGENPRIFAANLTPGESFDIELRYNVVPKVDGESILDSVQLINPLRIAMPTSSSEFSPVEKDILVANGINSFTSDGVASFKKLTFPVHTNTLQDLFYFPNIEEVDLTGGKLFELTTIDYNNNGVSKTIGGGPYLPFIRKVSPISNANAQTMVDLLELGLIKKVKYVPHSLGIDHLLEPSVERGVVELIETPSEQLIPMNLFLDGQVQSTAWALNIENPATSFPAGQNIVNPIKVQLDAKNGTFVFELPKEYRFNIPEYHYLKFKVYAPEKSTFDGAYAPYQRLWPRFMNYLWAFSSESSFGQELWNTNVNDFFIQDSNLEKWTEVTIDLSTIQDRHTRVFAINIGGEPSLTYDPSREVVYYFSNFRFTKD